MDTGDEALSAVDGVQHPHPLAVAAAVTILWGSFHALFQDDLKKRLAFSTVSQVSYIALGVALFWPAGTIGGLVHLVHHK